MKKTDTIALYKEAYLEGKSDEARRQFEEKDIDKQYGCIMAWRRRSGAVEKKTEASVSSIVSVLKTAKKDLSTLDSLSENDRERLHAAIDALKDDVWNFDRIKKGQRLRELESEFDKINKQGEDLSRKIEELRRELS